MTQTATETIGNGDKRKRILEAYTQTKCTVICVTCTFDTVNSDVWYSKLRRWFMLVVHSQWIVSPRLYLVSQHSPWLQKKIDSSLLSLCNVDLYINLVPPFYFCAQQNLTSRVHSSFLTLCLYHVNHNTATFLRNFALKTGLNSLYNFHLRKLKI